MENLPFEFSWTAFITWIFALEFLTFPKFALIHWSQVLAQGELRYLWLWIPSLPSSFLWRVSKSSCQCSWHRFKPGLAQSRGRPHKSWQYTVRPKVLLRWQLAWCSGRCHFTAFPVYVTSTPKPCWLLYLDMRGNALQIASAFFFFLIEI